MGKLNPFRSIRIFTLPLGHVITKPGEINPLLFSKCVILTFTKKDFGNHVTTVQGN